MRSLTPPRARGRLAAGVMAGALVLAACGGSDDSSSGAQAGDPLPAVDGTDGGSSEPAPIAQGDALVDLVGVDVLPASDVESNLLPDVVLDDVTNGRQVNFRNLVPQEKPILLWMYAPH